MRRMQIVLLLGVCMTCITARADVILLTQFDYDGYLAMEANLEADGHTVDIVDARTGGSVASALAATSYDQLFFWDLTASSYLNAADRAAMGTFFADHSSIVIDSRSYGYHFQPNQASEVALLQNVADQFSQRGGGVWVGTDHDPSWTKNANPWLNSVGLDPVTGIHSEPVNSWDPASVLLSGVTPTHLWGGGQSIGHVSLGIQPNGMDMRFHFGHSSPQSGAIPYISASFGDFIAPDEDPDDHIIIPTPSAFLLGGIGLAMVGRRLKRRKTA